MLAENNQISESQQTPHNSPSQASYGVSIVRIWEKINRMIAIPHCIAHHTGSKYKIQVTLDPSASEINPDEYG